MKPVPACVLSQNGSPSPVLGEREERRRGRLSRKPAWWAAAKPPQSMHGNTMWQWKHAFTSYVIEKEKEGKVLPQGKCLFSHSEEGDGGTQVGTGGRQRQKIMDDNMAHRHPCLSHSEEGEGR